MEKKIIRTIPNTYVTYLVLDVRNNDMTARREHFSVFAKLSDRQAEQMARERATENELVFIQTICISRSYAQYSVSERPFCSRAKQVEGAERNIVTKNIFKNRAAVYVANLDTLTVDTIEIEFFTFDAVENLDRVFEEVNRLYIDCADENGQATVVPVKVKSLASEPVNVCMSYVDFACFGTYIKDVEK